MSVSRELLEALLEGMVRDLRVCQQAPGDENARSSLMWRCALWGSRFSFPALPVREAAILSASDWEEYAGVLAVLLLSLCRREAEQSPAIMARAARRLWGRSGRGRSETQLARDGVRALEALAEELGLPTRPQQLDTAVQKRLASVPSAQNLLVHTA